MKTIGFIILRHVNSKYVNQYWIKCYDNIRKYYPENKIVIIDDNSNYEYITEKQLYKTIVIESKYKKRGELLPYYYFSKIKFFDIAVIIHDSVFINSYIHFNVDTFKMIWDFCPKYCNHDSNEELMMIKQFNDPVLNIYYSRKKWRGCFGCMTVITHEYLKSINKRYSFEKLVPFVKTRHNRQSFERVLACLLYYNNKRKIHNIFQFHNNTLLGNIVEYCEWGIKFEEIDDISLPIIKVWSGR